MKAIGAAVFMVGVFVASSAYAQKVMIVKDGTVDLTADTGLGNKNEHKRDKQKWNPKAELVEVFARAREGDACEASVQDAAPFDLVRIQVVFTGPGSSPVKRKFPIVADNSGLFFESLYLGFPARTNYLFKARPQGPNEYRLTDSPSGDFTDFHIEDIEVTYKDGTVLTVSSDETTPPRYLCVKFYDKHAARARPRK
jgi:hypothetical protein